MFGVITGQFSQLTHNSVIDSVENQRVSVNLLGENVVDKCVSADLGDASTVLLGDVLNIAER